MAKSTYKVIIVDPEEPARPKAYSSQDHNEVKRFLKERSNHGNGTLLVYRDNTLIELYNKGQRLMMEMKPIEGGWL